MKSLGQIGYEAYAQSTGGKTYDGRDMPTWEQVAEESPKVAKAWEDAGNTVRFRVVDYLVSETEAFATNMRVRYGGLLP